MAVTALRREILVALALIALPLAAHVARAQDSAVVARNDSVTVRLVDVDLRAAIQALARYLDRPVVFGALNGARVTLETPAPVPRAEVAALLRGVLESQNLELVADSGLYRVRSREQRPQPAPAEAAAAQRAQGAIELFVVRLRHARAADVAATVNALYGRASALGEIGERPGTLSDELRQNRVPPEDAAPPQAAAGAAGRQATLAGETSIVPDPRTNSLLIRASRSDFELIQAVITEVDVRPMQVLIEVLIAEVRRDRSFSFGVGAELPPTRLRGSTNTTVDATTTGIGLGDFVLRVMNVGNVELDATLRAASARGDVTIVSRPVLLTANNERAEILVGSQRPFVQVQRALPTDAPIRDQVVQYKDVGTQLVVLPSISADGYVMLDVVQEVNAATTETAFDAPVISTRSVQTRLLVKDGQTVVLGGLTDRQRDASQGGVPLLSSIPLLGGLFGRASRRTTETELFLFITPRVVRTDEEADAVTSPLRKRAEKAKP
ncbi:MAG: type II secretion system protein GspD [Gemmatimonadaceae bacterium]